MGQRIVGMARWIFAEFAQHLCAVEAQSILGAGGHRVALLAHRIRPATI
jgi:hypothetical protein